MSFRHDVSVSRTDRPEDVLPTVGEVLALDVVGHLPEWVQIDDTVVVNADGIGEMRPAVRLSVRSESRPVAPESGVA